MLDRIFEKRQAVVANDGFLRASGSKAEPVRGRVTAGLDFFQKCLSFLSGLVGRVGAVDNVERFVNPRDDGIGAGTGGPVGVHVANRKSQWLEVYSRVEVDVS